MKQGSGFHENPKIFLKIYNSLTTIRECSLEFVELSQTKPFMLCIRPSIQWQVMYWPRHPDTCLTEELLQSKARNLGVRYVTWITEVPVPRLGCGTRQPDFSSSFPTCNEISVKDHPFKRPCLCVTDRVLGHFSLMQPLFKDRLYLRPRPCLVFTKPLLRV
jgi:hypothetical protein